MRFLRCFVDGVYSPQQPTKEKIECLTLIIDTWGFLAFSDIDTADSENIFRFMYFTVGLLEIIKVNLTFYNWLNQDQRNDLSWLVDYIYMQTCD